MATVITCDWCGEPIEHNGTARAEYPPTIAAEGMFQEGGIINGNYAKLHYHARGRWDSDSCLAQAHAMLRDRSAWAHGGEDESGLEWRLMPRTARTDPIEGCPVGEEFKRRSEAGMALYELEITSSARQALRRANLVTLEEVAARDISEIRRISGVGPKTVQTLKEALDQLGLAFGQGATS